MRKRHMKRDKQRSDEAARRKRRLAEDIVVDGAKRGSGRHKRQRKLLNPIFSTKHMRDMLPIFYSIGRLVGYVRC